MRAAEFDERTNPSAVLYYAPRRTAAAEGSSIRPAPERLSRGERRTRPLTEPVPPAPKEEPIGAPGPGAVRMSALGIAARFIAVAGAGIGVAVIVAFSLQEPATCSENATMTATPMPAPATAIKRAAMPSALIRTAPGPGAPIGTGAGTGSVGAVRRSPRHVSGAGLIEASAAAVRRGAQEDGRQEFVRSSDSPSTHDNLLASIATLTHARSQANPRNTKSIAMGGH